MVLPRRKEYEEYKYKEYQGKCLKNFSGGGVNVRGVFVLGVIVRGVIVRGVIVRGVIVLIPDGGDPTMGSGESGTFSSTGGVATDGSLTGSLNELLSKILGNERSISAQL